MMKEKVDDGNVGISVLTGAVESIDINGPEARKVLRKIDCHLLPILTVTYFIQVRSPPN
jgi:glycine cleavage system aminomethyltransferase T